MPKALLALAMVDSRTARGAAAMDVAVRHFADLARAGRDRDADQPGGWSVICSDDIEWEPIRAAQGGWEEMYKWPVRNFDCLIVLETEQDALARGQTSMVQEFFLAGKPVGVVREGRIWRAVQIVYLPEEDWRRAYARVCLAVA